MLAGQQSKERIWMTYSTDASSGSTRIERPTAAITSGKCDTMLEDEDI
jgi:hypothetical protein